MLRDARLPREGEVVGSTKSVTREFKGQSGHLAEADLGGVHGGGEAPMARRGQGAPLSDADLALFDGPEPVTVPGGASPMLLPRSLSRAEALVVRAQQGDRTAYEEALTELAGIPETNREYVRARTLMAAVLREVGRTIDALRTLQHLLAEGAYTEDHLDALYEYGRVLELEGHLAEARSTYRIISDLAPTYRDVTRRLMELGNTGLHTLSALTAPPPAVPELPPSPSLPPVFQDPTAPSSRTGLILRGRFRVERLLSGGLQAEMYLARDLILDRLVAIKILTVAAANETVQVDRFMAEARFGAKVHHPNCLGVYDFGQENGVIFLALEYFAGHTLREVLQDRGTLPPRLGLKIGRDLAAALVAVHRARIIHRDLKPSTILLDDEQNARLTDFGVATYADLAAPEPTVVGSLRYMAPEQCVGPRPLEQSDVYALGAVMFEMLSGDLPFGNTVEAVFERMQRPPPELPREVRLPSSVRGLLSACLSADPASRPSSRQLMEALDGELHLMARDRPWL